MTSFHGITWDHPRGYRALEQAAASDPDGVIQWSRQPLTGFESHPIADLAARYDLLVLDHPHLGEAVAENCLLALDDLLAAEELDALASRTLGHAFKSYRWAGRVWALPLDVAAQVMARDPALVPAPPDTWDDVEHLATRVPVAPCLAGPHALLSFFSLCLALGEAADGDDLVSDAVGHEALGRLSRLARRAPRGSERLNPIALLEAMARGEGIALCPLVFGYVTYAAAGANRARLAFSDAPRIAAGGRRGSVLGGTGIAITTRNRPTPALLDRLRWLLAENTQRGFIPAHSGQPSARAAWLDAEVNRAAQGFYRDTFETVENAWVRPRFDGFVRFQTCASDALREALATDAAPAKTLDRLRRLWAEAHASARKLPSGETRIA